MRKTLLICLVLIFATAGRSFAAAGASDTERVSNIAVTAATLSINGTSTMHDYSLTTKTISIAGSCGSANDVVSLLQPGALEALELQIPVNTFVSEKEGLRERMLKALNADKHPTITFRLKTYVVDPAGPGGSVVVRPTGTLTVAGVERPIDLVLDVKAHAGTLQLRGTHGLSMKDFGVKPPTMFMGMLKTDDKVTITFDLQLSLVPTAQANKGL